MQTNFPAKRDIPTGHVLLAEYGDVDRADMSTKVLIAEGHSETVRSDVRLVWRSPGWEIASSCLRWTNGGWGVLWTFDNAEHGRRYGDGDEAEEAARAHFARLRTD